MSTQRKNKREKQADRYARQYVLKEIGKEGQKKLLESCVLVVGVGALGTYHASYLARAGVGKIILLDRDIVELNNLQRQALFDEEDVGTPKAVAAKEYIEDVNSSITVNAIVKDFNPMNAKELVSGDIDVLLDGTDNMDVRYLINDVCIQKKIPWIYGGAVGTSGMVYSVRPEGPCLRCIFPQPPNAGDLQTCDTAGVLNTLPGVVSGLQVTECFKILLGQEPSAKMHIVDLWTNEFRSVNVTKDENCPACSLGKFEFLFPEKRRLYTSLCGRNAVQIVPERKQKINLTQLAAKLSAVGSVEEKANVLFFKSEDADIIVFQDGRTIVKGTNDITEARILFSRYIGD
ncbi:MAG: ThiF family adenylyltransferase [Thermoplasmata archaeon]